MSSKQSWMEFPRPLRFLIIGGINTLFGYSCYAGLLFLGFHYAWAALFGTILGVLFNFVNTSKFVFDANPINIKQLQLFLLVYSLQYLITVFCLWLLDLAGLNPYISGLILILPMAAIVYLLMKHFVYKTERKLHDH